MRTLIKTFDSIIKKPLRVYIGDGDIEELSITINPKISMEKFDKYNLPLPLQYKELLAYSDGLTFFNSGDYTLYSLDDAVEYRDALEFKQNVLPIGYFLGETILLNCEEIEKETYLYAGSSICKDEFVALNLDIKGFLEKLLLNNCNCFWLEKEDVLYYDFSV